jgi:hypothetical protein
LCGGCEQKKEFVDVRKRTKEEADMQDLEFGFEDFKDGPDRLGWLVTYSAVTVVDVDTGAEVSGKCSISPLCMQCSFCA